MEKRKSSVRYAPEVRERAGRMVLEHAGDHASQWAAIVSISTKIGCTAETLRRRVRSFSELIPAICRSGRNSLTHANQPP